MKANTQSMETQPTCSHQTKYKCVVPLGQGYSIRNPKGPFAKFPFSPGSGTVAVKIPKHAQTVMWPGLICVKGDTFLWFKLGHKRCEGQAEALM